MVLFFKKNSVIEKNLTSFISLRSIFFFLVEYVESALTRMSPGGAEDQKNECENNLNGQLLDIRSLKEAIKAFEFCDTTSGCWIDGYKVRGNSFKLYSGVPFPLGLFRSGDGDNGQQKHLFFYDSSFFADGGTHIAHGLCRGNLFSI